MFIFTLLTRVDQNEPGGEPEEPEEPEPEPEEERLLKAPRKTGELAALLAKSRVWWSRSLCSLSSGLRMVPK